MDAATVQSMLQQHFDHSGSDPEKAHAMYHEDAVLEFPQSGERFEGVANTSFEFREVRGEGDLWIAELLVRYDDGPANHGVSVLEVRDGRIARETIYVAEGFDAPEWRAEWRAALEPRGES